MTMEDDPPVPASPPSLRHKLRHSLSFSCCFGRRHLSLRSPLPAPSDHNPPLFWIETKPPPCDQSLSEVKDKCISIFAAAAGNGKHRRHASAEFTYDPLSYAMNFEDGSEFDDEAPLKSFSARLPPSPPLPSAVTG